MSKVIVQIGISTKAGGVIPFASTRDPTLARIVAQHIIGELTTANFADAGLRLLAAEEAKTIHRVMGGLAEATPRGADKP
ncbi:MAG: hypothetical protein ABSG98_11280 [Anaerolineales bacterium]|jgi:hypothetical protein